MQLITDTRLAQEDESASPAATNLSGAVSKTPQELANIVSSFASSDGWMEKVRLQTDQRWYERLYHGPDYDIWVISWLPGQSTGFHDHGASSGALVAATGILEEYRPGERSRVIHPGQPLPFGPDYAHDVRNASLAPAISIEGNQARHGKKKARRLIIADDRMDSSCRDGRRDRNMGEWMQAGGRRRTSGKFTRNRTTDRSASSSVCRL